MKEQVRTKIPTILNLLILITLFFTTLPEVFTVVNYINIISLQIIFAGLKKLLIMSILSTSSISTKLVMSTWKSTFITFLLWTLVFEFDDSYICTFMQIIVERILSMINFFKIHFLFSRNKKSKPPTTSF